MGIGALLCLEMLLNSAPTSLLVSPLNTLLSSAFSLASSRKAIAASGSSVASSLSASSSFTSSTSTGRLITRYALAQMTVDHCSLPSGSSRAITASANPSFRRRILAQQITAYLSC